MPISILGPSPVLKSAQTTWFQEIGCAVATGLSLRAGHHFGSVVATSGAAASATRPDRPSAMTAVRGVLGHRSASSNLQALELGTPPTGHQLPAIDLHPQSTHRKVALDISCSNSSTKIAFNTGDKHSRTEVVQNMYCCT
uniref:Uncharacterized protein n=1 Tax=Zea mays TaxID=4577 RepID=A0A804UI71_MAIZE